MLTHANLADPVCVYRTLGDQEESGRTDGALLTARTATAVATVLIRATTATGQKGPTHLMAINTMILRTMVVKYNILILECLTQCSNNAQVIC